MTGGRSFDALVTPLPIILAVVKPLPIPHPATTSFGMYHRIVRICPPRDFPSVPFASKSYPPLLNMGFSRLIP